MQAAVNLKGCDMRLGALCLPDARLGLVLAKSHVDLSIGLFELGHPQAQALVRHALKKGRLPVALEADGQHLFIDTQLTSMARGVFEDSQGRLPAPMAASHRAAAQVIKHLRAFNTAHSYAPEPETLQHIIVSLCTGDA